MSKKAHKLDELVDGLSSYILSRWEIETSEDAALYAGAYGDKTAGRELIENFLTYCDELKICPTGGTDVTSCFYAFKKVLKRALDVDMNDPANRKGERE